MPGWQGGEQGRRSASALLPTRCGAALQSRDASAPPHPPAPHPTHPPTYPPPQDRRPASNLDPYVVTRLICESALLM